MTIMNDCIIPEYPRVSIDQPAEAEINDLIKFHQDMSSYFSQLTTIEENAAATVHLQNVALQHQALATSYQLLWSACPPGYCLRRQGQQWKCLPCI